MNPRTRRPRLALLTLVPAVLFLVGFGWLTYVYVQRAKLKPLLVAAVKAKDATRVHELLDRGADPNARDRPATGFVGLRGLFLSLLGRDPETKSNRGKTTLMIAAGNEDRASVKLLLDKGASINARDEEGNTALMEAAEVAAFLETTNTTGRFGFQGVQIGRPEDSPDVNTLPVYDVLKLLLERGADVNAKNTDSDTALLAEAFWTERLDCEKLLLDYHADVNHAGVNGETVLIQAAEGGRPDLVNLLLARGANVHVQDIYGRTCLYYAVHSGHTEIVAVLLARGVDVNLRDRDGDTALITAAKDRHIGADMLQLLVKKGAKINVRNSFGETALHWAMVHDNEEAITLLKKYGANE